MGSESALAMASHPPEMAQVKCDFGPNSGYVKILSHNADYVYIPWYAIGIAQSTHTRGS